MKYIDQCDEKSEGQYQPRHSFLRVITYLTVCAILLPIMTGCTLQRDEHTVQFQQMHQPNEQSESLPVWRDVYSESVVHDVYSPQGNTGILP